MFRAGDKIVHPMHGAGVVESVVQQKVNGVTRDYYVLKLPLRSMVVMIPTQNSVEIGVRPIIDSAQADDILAKLAAFAKEAQLTEKYAALYNGEVINTGEKRRVLHQLTRGQLGGTVMADGVDKRAFYAGEQEKLSPKDAADIAENQ
mgnify:CR=1 FL=1